MKEIIEKHKKELIIFLISFIIYFSLGLLFSYYLNLHNSFNVMFDIDSPRVYWDLSIIDSNHYRCQVHPLFVIIFQPIVLAIKFFTKDSTLAILLLQSLCASLSLVIMYKILKKVGIKEKLNIVLILIFGFSFSQIIFASNIETYIFAQVFLLALWLFVLIKIDKELKYWDYILLVLLGIFSLAVTLTNFFQFLIALSVLIIFNKNMKKKIFTCIFIIITAISISVLLADLQQLIWPSAPNYFIKNITDFTNGTSEEMLYTDKTISFSKVQNLANSNFGYSYNVFKLTNYGEKTYITFKESKITNFISMMSLITFIMMNIIFIYKTKNNLKNHKFYYAILGVWLINFILHYFYGNSIAFLYSCHYNFCIIILTSYILNYFHISDINKKWLLIFLIFLSIIPSLLSTLTLFLKLHPYYENINYIRILPCLIILFLIICLNLLIFKKIKNKIIFSIISFIIMSIGWLQINFNIIPYLKIFSNSIILQK